MMSTVAFTKLTFLSRLIGLVQGMPLKLKFARLLPPSLCPLVFRLVSPIKGGDNGAEWNVVGVKSACQTLYKLLYRPIRYFYLRNGKTKDCAWAAKIYIDIRCRKPPTFQ